MTSKKKEEKNKNNSKILLIVVGIVLLFLIINYISSSFIFSSDSKSDLKEVKKVLNTNYDEVKCSDSSCNYVIAIKEDGIKKKVFNVFNLNGKKVLTYTLDSKKLQKNEIVTATSNYLIVKESVNENVKYNVIVNNGKKAYTSNFEVKKINDYLVSAENNKKTEILDYRGKVLYSNVRNFSPYYNSKYVFIDTKKEKLLVNEKGKVLLKNYVVAYTNTEENNKYFIVKNEKDNKYNYFNIDKNKIMGESFYNYAKEGMDVVVMPKENDFSTRKYLTKNGKTKDYIDSEKEYYKEISKKVKDTKYYIYKYGIVSKNQKYVLVNNQEENAFGILNVNTNKFKQLFKYKVNNSFGVLSSEIDEKNKEIVRITCSSKYCEESGSYVYNLKTNEEIYKDKNNGVISYFALYEDGYKVVKYSVTTTGPLNGVSKVFDKNNKELVSKDSLIVIIDKKNIYKTNSGSLVYLYDTKKNSIINNEISLANTIYLNDNTIYRTSKDSRVILFNDKGKKICDISSDSYLTYSNNYVIYKNKGFLKIYNANKSRSRFYKISKNEEFRNPDNNVINSYRGLTFVMNNKKHYTKIINPKGRVIKKVNDGYIKEVKDSENGKVLLIIKDKKNNKDKYGLYIAK